MDISTPRKLLGSVFGRTDFSRIFIFGPPDFFADFLAGFFLLIFVGKSGQKNPPGKSPGKSSKIYTTKILQHISADCPGQKLLRSLGPLPETPELPRNPSRSFSSHKSLTDPDTLENYRDTPPISSAMLLQKYALLLAESSIYTPPICVTIRLPFVSRYICKSIRVRGRWNTPKFLNLRWPDSREEICQGRNFPEWIWVKKFPWKSWIFWWIFRWISSCSFSQGKWPGKNPRKIHPKIHRGNQTPKSTSHFREGVSLTICRFARISWNNRKGGGTALHPKNLLRLFQRAGKRLTVNGEHAGTNKDPNWGHVKNRRKWGSRTFREGSPELVPKPPF